MSLPDGRRSFLIGLALSLATLIVYLPVGHQDFVTYDDDVYLTGNPHVVSGLTWENVRWAFTDSTFDWWHPLTWLSHMLDVTLFGMNAGPQHLTNLAFHVANTLLLFVVLERMTGAAWRSGFVAAMFALHPLHVESVAWVTERKDVLSTLFWMLTLWAYCRYAERPRVSRYLLVMLAFLLGLMAKPMLVTLPFVLLLLDYWPLNRLDLASGRWEPRHVRLVLEKIPLLMLTVASSVLTYIGQQHAGKMMHLAELPIGSRLANALLSYAGYLAKMVWPARLAVFYPYPTSFPAFQMLGAGLILVAISALAIRLVRQQPYLIVGWLWYVGTLVPVVGLVQVGGRAMADRFTYVPLIGVFIMLAWGVPVLWQRLRISRISVGELGGGAIAAYAAMTFFQLQYWQNGVTLFEHALAVTDGNFIAHNNLGVTLMRTGRVKEAVPHFQQALALWPEYPEANKSLADVLASAGQTDEAVRYYHRALQARPDWADAENNLGLALAGGGQLTEAVSHFSRAVQLEPKSETGHLNLGLACMKLKNTDLALVHLSQALALNPADPQAHYLMGQVLQEQGRRREAAGHFEEALRLRPDYEEARAALETLSR
jgi:Flp pilus assembly protein TadD